MKLEHTRCLSLLLRSYPYDLATWNDLMVAFDDIGGARGNVLAEAHAIERFYNQKLAEMLPTASSRKLANGRESRSLTRLTPSPAILHTKCSKLTQVRHSPP